MRLSSTTFLFLSLLCSQAHGICECGYRIRLTDAYYTSVFISNFSSMPDARALNTDAPLFNRDWTVQSWSAPPNRDNPLARTNDPNNVWIENGALILRQRGYSEGDNQAGRNVSCAAIVSKRNNFGRVSARAVFEVDVGDVYPRGSVAGFFWYFDDKNEVDIEVLAKEANDTQIHYTTHPSLDSNQQPNLLALNRSKLRQPWTEVQSHRFDILPGNATFFQNNVSVHSTTTNVPAKSVAGTLQLNLWASGSEWSGFPSRENVTMRVSQILVFYNESGDPGLTPAAADACKKVGGPEAAGAMCWDQGGAFGVRNSASKPGNEFLWIYLTFMGIFWSILV
ncbi:MAG: hypothetical protein M1814_006836 [Vezdaea aestivalis]|nr:MAG: hypothetical protein M1814_006836 [Vezdaea aestivalis]